METLCLFPPFILTSCISVLHPQNRLGDKNDSVFGANPGRRDPGAPPNPIWADEGLHGFLMAPPAYRLVMANDRARAMAPLEGPMVPLDPPSPDISYDYRREKEERMERKRVRCLRPRHPANLPIPYHTLDSILQDSANMMSTCFPDFRRI